MDFLSRLFDTSDFPERWHCGNWTQAHGWLHVLSDLGVWSAYFAIPCLLGWFILHKRNLPFRWIFLLFGAFILACGMTHLMDAAIFWWPAYRLSGLIKLVTAIVSWVTVIALIPAIPKALAMRSPEELEAEIARRRRAEEDLHRANEDLERRVQERTTELRELTLQLSEADRRKNVFLATLAHELRNPLAPLSSGIEALRLSTGDAETMAVVQPMMERQMRQLVSIVDDLLDVSRITRGKLDLRRRRIALSEVVDGAVEASRPLIDASAQSLVIDLPADPVVLEVDPTRLSQVLSNLLNNASKYTPAGGSIRLHATTENDEVVLTVSDTGRGIPADALEHVFDMFMQGDRPPEAATAGLGIGLTLVKALVEMHGGSAVARSAGPGQGSAFEIRLPLPPDQTDGEASPVVPPADRLKPADGGWQGRPKDQPCRVLVVDDNADAATALGMVLRVQGHDVRVAGDGQEALRVGEEFQPDVVFMDLGMPRMDGFEAARAVRQRPWGSDVLLVAVSGWGQQADRERTQEAGFDHHLVKPADPAAVERMLREGC